MLESEGSWISQLFPNSFYLNDNTYVNKLWETLVEKAIILNLNVLRELLHLSIVSDPVDSLI